MKRPLKFWDKIVIFKRLLQNDEYGIRGCCSMCKSTKLTVRESNTETLPYMGKEYKATYACMNCGAVAEVIELWSKKEH